MRVGSGDDCDLRQDQLATHLFRLFNLSTHISEWRDYLEEGPAIVLSAGRLAIVRMCEPARWATNPTGLKG